MAINVSVQYNGGLLPDIIRLTLCYYHRATRLNAMKRLLSLQPMIPPKRFDIPPPPDWGMLRRSRCVQIFLLNSNAVRTSDAVPSAMLTSHAVSVAIYHRL